MYANRYGMNSYNVCEYVYLLKVNLNFHIVIGASNIGTKHMLYLGLCGITKN